MPINLISDKIRYYTNIVLSGSLAVAPLIYYLQMEYVIDKDYFIPATILAILFIGRICLEIGFYIEGELIDYVVSFRIEKQNNYPKIIKKMGKHDKNWIHYLKLDNNKFVHEVVSNMADRMLFFLSTNVGAFICAINIIFIFKPDTITVKAVYLFLVLFSTYSFLTIIRLSTALDLYRWLALNNIDEQQPENNPEH